MSEAAEEHRRAAPTRLSFSVLTISDSRTLASDRSGQLLVSEMQRAGHQLLERGLVADEPAIIAAEVCRLADAGQVDVLLLTGGTGIAPRDTTPEAVRPLLEVELPGFGELFRWLSYQEIGAATILSRALAGRRGQALIFCLPGSTAAVRLALEKILLPELPHLVHHARG